MLKAGATLPQLAECHGSGSRYCLSDVREYRPPPSVRTRVELAQTDARRVDGKLLELGSPRVIVGKVPRAFVGVGAWV